MTVTRVMPIYGYQFLKYKVNIDGPFCSSVYDRFVSFVIMRFAK